MIVRLFSADRNDRILCGALVVRSAVSRGPDGGGSYRAPAVGRIAGRNCGGGRGSIDCPPSAPTSPFATSSWVAPTIATPAIEESARQPIAAPADVRADSPANNAPGPIVSMIVSFQRPSFQLVGSPLPSAVKVAEGAEGTQELEAELAGLAQWAGRVRFEVDGQPAGFAISFVGRRFSPDGDSCCSSRGRRNGVNWPGRFCSAPWDRRTHRQKMPLPHRLAKALQVLPRL